MSKRLAKFSPLKAVSCNVVIARGTDSDKKKTLLPQPQSAVHCTVTVPAPKSLQPKEKRIKKEEQKYREVV